MLRKYALVGYAVAFMTAMMTAALAVGQAPLPQGGPALPDQSWLLGVANGQNASYQYGITASGTTQGGAFQLPAAITLFEVDTAAASSGVALPTAVQGTEISLYNNGANTLTVYPAIANNPATGSQDTINNGTSFSGGVASHASVYCFSAKTGIWACK